ncbi:hypothetical protein [Xanthomonas albilineans]|uniref:Uncharacterized protein n=1 Tax=Xanthomonas albilineans (strain GPE PC73 / CFBP 7063) TaxID=380358 RepID=D2U8I1_XANAP|nr:hypothetical protein [Xanthomonas albilineans]CBA14720.1 hypothetical protein XALC_0174 [Xanthomonas albilineans GPE PC73]
MNKININFADSLRVVNDENASSDARVIASLALAYLTVIEVADEIQHETASIAQKLMRMTASEIDKAREDQDERARRGLQ